MVKKKRSRLDFERLSTATMEAINSFATDNQKDGLVEYLREQAQQKPSAFLGLLIKMTQLNNPEEEQKDSKKVTRIELIVPTTTFEDIDNEKKEQL